MIKTATVGLQPITSARNLWVECVVAGRLIAYIKEYERKDWGEFKPEVLSEIRRALERLLSVGGHYWIIGTDSSNEFQGDVAQFDEETGLALIGVTTAHNKKERAAFYAHFNLTPAALTEGESEPLSYIVVRIPQKNTDTPLKAVAVLALGEDAWLKDAYAAPDHLRKRIIAAAFPYL